MLKKYMPGQTKVYGHEQQTESVKPLPAPKTQKEFDSRIQQVQKLQAENQELNKTVNTLKKIDENNKVIKNADESLTKLAAAQLRIQQARQAKLDQQAK